MDDESEGSAIVLAVGAIAPVVVAAALVLVRDHVVNANLAMILMGIVVLVAAAGGRRAGLVAAVIATLAFDFFLTEPYLTLRVTSSDDIETMIVMLIVAVVIGEFAERAHRNRAETAATRSEIRRIRRMADLMSQGSDRDSVVRAGATEIHDLLRLAECRFEEPPFVAALPRLERSGVIEQPDANVVVRRYARGGFELPADGVELPIFHRGQEVGRYVLTPTPGVGTTLEQRVVALALADQVGASFAS